MREAKNKKRSLLVVISILLAAVYWFFESFIHYFKFGYRGYWEEFLYPDAHEIWMRSFVVVIFLVFGLYADSIIRRREKAEEDAKIAFAEMDKIFNTAADGMRIIDKDFNVLKINDTLISLNGVSRKMAENKKCYAGFPGVDCGTPKCSLERVLKGEKRIEYETKKECKNGKIISCIVTATPFYGHNGKIIGIIEDFKDISDRKKIENVLIESKKNLEEKVEERTKELEKIQKDLVESERLASLGKMASAVAHELRNPMGVIKLAVYSLKQKSVDSDSRRHLDNIDKKINESDQIIHDLLSFTRVPKLKLKNNSVSEIIDSSLQCVADAIEQSGVMVNKEISLDLPKIKTDFNQLSEVFCNMFFNSAQAMKNSSEKILDIIAKQQGKYVEIEIKDTGCGISRENIKRLGEPFFSTKSKGIGLGLYIAYEIVHRHKGNIGVKSRLGKGTSFIIQLPI